MSKSCGMGNYYYYYQLNLKGKNNIIYVSLVNQRSLTPTLADVGAEMPELGFSSVSPALNLLCSQRKANPRMNKSDVFIKERATCSHFFL